MAPVPRKIIGTLLALVLAGGNIVTFLVWPKGPLWKIPPAAIVGFSESQGLLFTSTNTFDPGRERDGSNNEPIPSQNMGIRMTAWKLTTGRKDNELIIPNPFKNQPNSDQGQEAPHQVAVSPCGKFAAMWAGHSIFIYSLPSTVLLRRLRADATDPNPTQPGSRAIHTVGFSADSASLAAVTPSGLFVWDMQSGSLTSEIALSPETLSSWFRVEFSPDSRLLLARYLEGRRGFNYAGYRVFDLKNRCELYERKYVLEITNDTATFLADGSLVVVTEQYGKGTLHRIRFADGVALEAPRKSLPEGAVLAISQNYFMTVNASESQLYFRVYDIQTQVEVFSMEGEPEERWRVGNYFHRPPLFLSTSTQSQWVAKYHFIDGNLTLIRFPPSRPFLCFLASGALALLSVFILWRTWLGKQGVTPGAANATSG